MSIGGLTVAVVLGVSVGALGRLVVPDREGMPAWFAMVAGIVAAFAGTGLADVFGITDGGWSFGRTALQFAGAVVGVSVVTVLWPKRTR